MLEMCGDTKTTCFTTSIVLGQQKLNYYPYREGQRKTTMAIFRLERSEGDDMSNAVLVIATETNLELERYLEDWLENSPVALVQDEYILWIGRQTSATDEDGTVYPDLLGVDFKGNLVITELKRARTPRDIIAQLLDYAAWADGLSESQIRGIAENYFETRDGFQGRTFDDAFREIFDMPETDELPPLNQGLRLFIVAEEIPVRVAHVCRFLRTSHGMDVSCIDVSTFETESGEVLVSTETKVGDEEFAATSTQRPSLSLRSSGDKPVKEVVWEAVREFTRDQTEVEFTIKDITAIILKKDPDFKKETVNGQITADTVNHPSRHHHSGTEDRYWRIERGKYRLYDPENDNMEGDSA